jgi:hypothetical protein
VLDGDNMDISELEMVILVEFAVNLALVLN